MDGSGTSGKTYKEGMIGAMESCNPALVFYENVVGVAQRSKDTETGEILPPQVEARRALVKIQHILYIYIYLYV